ncbi:hypothetical protein LCGC14_1367860 [marine sediment metagenome]|uniref:YopX protein domain-containing protein n=1 Tax=marine sediment metagenome TaxID=412755 RepID=A0A0F9MLE2_9ZZZZ
MIGVDGIEANERGSKMLTRTRIWDGEKMWYPEDFENPLSHFLVAMDGTVGTLGAVPSCWREMIVLDAIAMPSIGMEDKKGKEVWVGDIVEFDSHECDWELVQAEVQQWPGLFVLYRESPERVYEIAHVAGGEVVGNVHEEK